MIQVRNPTCGEQGFCRRGRHFESLLETRVPSTTANTLFTKPKESYYIYTRLNTIYHIRSIWRPQCHIGRRFPSIPACRHQTISGTVLPLQSSKGHAKRPVRKEVIRTIRHRRPPKNTSSSDRSRMVGPLAARPAWQLRCFQRHIAMLRQLIVTHDDCPVTDFTTSPWKDALLVTPRHAVRMKWNNMTAKTHTHTLGITLIKCPAFDTVQVDN